MAACSACDEQLDLEAEWRALDALAVVDTVRLDSVHEKAHQQRSTSRAICTLWCGSTHDPGDLRQPSVKCNQSTCPSIEHAVRALRVKITEKHAGCLAAAETARAAAGGPSTRSPPDGLAAIMAARKAQQASELSEAALKAAKTRAEAARQTLVAAELEVSKLTAAAVRHIISIFDLCLLLSLLVSSVPAQSSPSLSLLESPP